eukprot:gene11890-biopygen7855
MLGNVWQYTDEFYDNRSRFALLKGGSNYVPKWFTVSHTGWY